MHDLSSIDRIRQVVGPEGSPSGPAFSSSSLDNAKYGCYDEDRNGARCTEVSPCFQTILKNHADRSGPSGRSARIWSKAHCHHKDEQDTDHETEELLPIVPHVLTSLLKGK